MASTQSFTLLQQATHVVITITAGSRRTYIGAILSAHPVRGASRMRRCADREFATVIQDYNQIPNL